MIVSYTNLERKYSLFNKLRKKLEEQQRVAEVFESLAAETPGVGAQVDEAHARAKTTQAEMSSLMNEMIEDFDLVEKANLRSILVMRYFEGLAWGEISRRSGYEEKYAITLRRKALKEILLKKTLNQTQSHERKI